MIRIIEGDILQAQQDIIGHQVNCKGVMGAGLAKQIKMNYPNVFEEYKQLCKEQGMNLLGTVQYVKTSKGKIFANIFGQANFGRGKRQTDYEALEEAFYSLRNKANETNRSIALPYGIGCGLAGGDWDIVYRIIEKVFIGSKLHLYRFN